MRRIVRWSGAVATTVVALAALARRTARQLRRLRDDGARVPPLDHATTLPGSGQNVELVVLGDSAAAGHGLPHADDGLARRIGRRLAAAIGRPVTVTSLAVDGATTTEVLALQVPRLPAGAEVVVIGVGVNDAVRARGRATVSAATTQLLAGVRDAAPDATLVLLTCPDLGSAPAMPAVLRAPLRWSCRRVAAAQRSAAAAAGVRTVGADGYLPASAFGPDGFHPGPIGVGVLADRVADALLGDEASGPAGHDQRSASTP